MGGMMMPNGQIVGSYRAPSAPRPGPLNATPVAGMGTRNATQADPTVSAWMKRLQGEHATQSANVNAPLHADTQRMMDRSATNIADQGAAARNTMDENLARRGIAGGGLEAQMQRDLAASTQRAQAQAGADIVMRQQERQDTVNLQRQGLANQLLAAGVGAANMPAQLALQQQGLSLNQMSLEAQMQAERERLRQMDLERQAREAQLLNQYQQQTGVPVYGGGTGSPRTSPGGLGGSGTSSGLGGIG